MYTLAFIMYPYTEVKGRDFQSPPSALCVVGLVSGRKKLMEKVIGTV